MAIRPDINLAGSQANLTTVLPLFQEAREARQRRDLMPLESQQAAESVQEASQDRLTRSVVQGAAMVKPFVDKGDFEGAMRSLMQRKAQLQARGVDTSNTDQAISLLQTSPNDFINSMNSLVDFGQRTGIIRDPLSATAEGERSRKKNLEILQDAINPNTGRLKDRSQLTVEQEIAAIDERIIPPAVGSAAQTIASQGNVDEVSETEKTIQRGKESGKGIAKTDRRVIDEGLDAAKGIPVLRRSLQLLDDVKTGGLAAANLRAKQFFGVEGADEGELSANLGQAILGDLRSTFGAAFTEREGQRLERIRANLGRSAAANRRLINQALQISESAALRAMDRAIDSGDTQTAEDIQALLDTVLADEQQQGQDQILRFDAQGNLIQ